MLSFILKFSPPDDHKYPALKTFADGSSVVDACAGSRAEYVSPNILTFPSPETLAGGPCSRDAIMGFGVVSLTLSLARDLAKDLFHFMGLNTSCINDANLLFDAYGQILLVATVGVFLVASAAGATGHFPCSEGLCPLHIYEAVYLMFLCWSARVGSHSLAFCLSFLYLVLFPQAKLLGRFAWWMLSSFVPASCNLVCFCSVCVAMAAVFPGYSIAVLGVAVIYSLVAIRHPS
ncbi:hypothetical protein Peur_037041 [Populus x canadensis]